MPIGDKKVPLDHKMRRRLKVPVWVSDSKFESGAGSVEFLDFKTRAPTTGERVCRLAKALGFSEKLVVQGRGQHPGELILTPSDRRRNGNAPPAPSGSMPSGSGTVGDHGVGNVSESHGVGNVSESRQVVSGVAGDGDFVAFRNRGYFEEREWPKRFAAPCLVGLIVEGRQVEPEWLIWVWSPGQSSDCTYNMNGKFSGDHFRVPPKGPPKKGPGRSRKNPVDKYDCDTVRVRVEDILCRFDLTASSHLNKGTHQVLRDCGIVFSSSKLDGKKKGRVDGS